MSLGEGSETAVIAMGSSLGDSFGALRLACAAVGQLAGVRRLWPSRIFATPAEGGVARRRFLNAAVRVETTLGPFELLEALRVLERRLGRRPTRRWADRVIDLDLLLYGEGVMSTTTLAVPHPRLHSRAFALQPLMDCWPGVPEPWAGLARAGRRLPVVGVLGGRA